MIQRLLCVFILSVTAVAQASPENSSLLKSDFEQGDLARPQGVWSFLGLSTGGMDHGAAARSGGVVNQMKVLGSYYFQGRPWVADLGVGLHNEFLTQSGAGSDSIQSLYSEAAGRYTFSNRWQLGAIWNTLVDNPHRYRSNNDNLASFLGAQALKEFSWNDEYLVRVGGRAMTSVGVNGGSINTIMAELEVSFGSNSKSIQPMGANTTNVPIQALERSESRALAPHLANQAMLSFVAAPRIVHFATNSAQLTPKAGTYFDKLANVLVANRHLFERVKIIGHTDEPGSGANNELLAVQRAQIVAQRLFTAGLNRDQVVVDGRVPANATDEAMPTRWVELRFAGVKDPSSLRAALESLTP